MSSVFLERLSAVRREIAAAGVDGFIVPRTDAYQSEYVPPSAERVAFLSGFTGSAGVIVVLKEVAAFFTDGRYTLQAAAEVSSEFCPVFDVEVKTPFAWLEENAGKGAKIAYDPWLHTIDGVERLKAALEKAGATTVPATQNFVDLVWTERPKELLTPVVPHAGVYTGKESSEKRRELAVEIEKKQGAAALVCDPASVAWLLNVRGGDVPYTPVPLSRAILHADASAEWFVESCRIPDALRASIGADVSILDPDAFSESLEGLARNERPVLVDPAQTPSWIYERLLAANAKVERAADLCALPRAIKTGAELEGMRAAHVRDGAALANFLAWLDAHWESGRISERDAQRKLAEFREATIHYRGPSFETISATGAHGAIIHYGATEESDTFLQTGQLYLVDSGGQYLDGTTDVTRTVALGAPSPERRENFTRVLKGHVALASIRFPESTTGAHLDALARQYLWSVGRDYRHGTGHGVGSYLGVHEGPQAISRRNTVPLKPGMVLSNEPGFYKEGSYGIRIESLQTVVEIEGKTDDGSRLFGFDVLTLSPFDRRLIDVSLLTADERGWIDRYHERVRKILISLVDEATVPWLEAATQELADPAVLQTKAVV